MRAKVKRALAAAAAIGLLSACGTDDPVADGPVSEAEETRLLELLNESARLQHELRAAENRIVLDCLEDLGHTVHDPYAMFDPGEAFIFDTLAAGAPLEFLPDAETAARWGFGGWTSSPDADPSEVDEYFAVVVGADDGPKLGGLDTSAWDALSEQEQYAWTVDHIGEAHAAELLSGAAAHRDEDEFHTPAEPGGCLADMADALYGGARLVEDLEHGQAHWEYGPQSPVDQTHFDYDAVVDAYLDGIAGAQTDFLDCIAGRGHGDWELDGGELRAAQYWEQIYLGFDDFDDDGPAFGVPAPPPDLPVDFASRRAAEADMALGFVECADDTGFEETAHRAYRDAYAEQYAAIEVELYAWQEAMSESLEKAQRLLSS